MRAEHRSRRVDADGSNDHGAAGQANTNSAGQAIFASDLVNVVGRVRPRSGLIAITCPACAAHHFHNRVGPTKGACGAQYRVAVEAEGVEP